jgi:anti-sigma B factor antagonist
LIRDEKPVVRPSHDTWRLAIVKEVAGDVSIVTATGRLDAAAAVRLEAELNQVAGTPNVILDLTGVDYASSAALAVLTGFIDRQDLQASRVVLCGAGDALRLTFDLAGLSERLRVAPSRAAAAALLTGPATPR